MGKCACRASVRIWISNACRQAGPLGVIVSSALDTLHTAVRGAADCAAGTGLWCEGSYGRTGHTGTPIPARSKACRPYRAEHPSATAPWRWYALSPASGADRYTLSSQSVPVRAGTRAAEHPGGCGLRHRIAPSLIEVSATARHRPPRCAPRPGRVRSEPRAGCALRSRYGFPTLLCSGSNSAW
jgi:hypothetical protein